MGIYRYITVVLELLYYTKHGYQKAQMSTRTDKLTPLCSIFCLHSRIVRYSAGADVYRILEKGGGARKFPTRK